MRKFIGLLLLLLAVCVGWGMRLEAFPWPPYDCFSLGVLEHGVMICGK